MTGADYLRDGPNCRRAVFASDFSLNKALAKFIVGTGQCSTYDEPVTGRGGGDIIPQKSVNGH